jgi:protein-S-isoprenylcysteine O-methyltransferase Ste14
MWSDIWLSICLLLIVLQAFFAWMVPKQFPYRPPGWFVTFIVVTSALWPALLLLGFFYMGRYWLDRSLCWFKDKFKKVN